MIHLKDGKGVLFIEADTLEEAKQKMQGMPPKIQFLNLFIDGVKQFYKDTGKAILIYNPNKPVEHKEVILDIDGLDI